MPLQDLIEKTDFFENPMLLVSASGTIESSNTALSEELGLGSQQLAGRQLESLAALSAAAIEEYLRACSKTDKALQRSFLLRGRKEEVAFEARGIAYPPSSAPSAPSVLLRLHAMREQKISRNNKSSREVVSYEEKRKHWQEVEESLRRQSQILEVTLASIGDAVIVTDTQSRVTFLNSVAEQLTGWSYDEARNKPLSDIFPIVNERTREPVEDPVGKVLATGAIAGLANHTILLAKDGREVPIDDSAAPIRLPNGQLFGVVLIFRDITEQRRAEHTRAWLAAIVESSEDAIISKTLSGTITSWNPAATRLFGYRAEEVIGKSIMMLVPPELQDEERTVLERLSKGERIEHFDTVRKAKDGRRVDVSLTVSPIRDEEGNIVGASKTARDISERKRTEQRLKEAEYRKDQFMATLGHELRNPMAPIQNATELLCKGEQTAASKRACEILRRQVRIMRSLVDDLLDVSRVSTGRLTIKQETLDMVEVLTNTIDSLRHEFEAKQQTLEVSVPEGTLPIESDRTRLTQVFSNLLNNAKKYTQSGGRIRVVLARDGSQAVLKVADNGIGIGSTMLPHIFDLFFQGRRTDEQPADGLGIGLALAKTLVGMHGGTIEARSAGEGSGSEFIVRIPLSTTAESVQRSAHARDDARRQRIIVADDNYDSAASLAMLLEAMGHEVHVAYDGVAAVETAKRIRPDIVFLDLAMPVMDGYEAARRIAREPWGRKTKLVALTGFGHASDRLRTQEIGFHQHLVKPLDMDALEALLAQDAQ